MRRPPRKYATMALTTLIPGRPSRARAAIGSEVAARLDANPCAERLPTDKAQAWRIPEYLDAATCERLIAMIDASRRPSTLMTTRDNVGFRTSESCDMDRYSAAIQPIDEAIADLLGLPPTRGETLQGQRYALGQQFRAHHDYFHEGEDYWPRMQASGGQRTWTAMIYLNAVEEGGAPWFPEAGFRVAPKPGLLLAWNNMIADGSPNPATLHEGTAVNEGVKYIVTKWFRERDWVVAG